MIYQTARRAAIESALEDEGLQRAGSRRASSSPTRLAPARTRWPSGSAASEAALEPRDEAAAPGLHGNGVAGVTLGGQALDPGRLGQHHDHRRPHVRGAGREPGREHRDRRQGEGHRSAAAATRSRPTPVLDTIAAGETKPVEIPLPRRPPTGQNVPIAVEIEAVPGEEKIDNNEAEFSAIFTR